MSVNLMDLELWALPVNATYEMNLHAENLLLLFYKNCSMFTTLATSTVICMTIRIRKKETWLIQFMTVENIIDM